MIHQDQVIRLPFPLEMQVIIPGVSMVMVSDLDSFIQITFLDPQPFTGFITISFTEEIDKAFIKIDHIIIIILSPAVPVGVYSGVSFLCLVTPVGGIIQRMFFFSFRSFCISLSCTCARIFFLCFHSLSIITFRSFFRRIVLLFHVISDDDLRILLERHRDGLMLFLFSFVHNLEDAEELMLDAFAEAAAGAGFSGRSSFKTWLFSIGKKLAFMRLRKTRFTYSLEDKMIREPDCFPELNILTAERNQQLYQALGQLKEEYRQILILMYFEEMSHEEIGKVMGKTKKQTYHLAERGRAALREKLERMGFDYAQY